MPPTPSESKQTKFTRGEKCLFVHLIVTFGIIMIMTLTYFAHLCIVRHTNSEVLKIYRRSYDHSQSGLSLPDYQSVGVMFLNVTPPTIVCVTLLLADRWSLAPAQCTSTRDDPDMSDYLLHWKIKYKIAGKHLHSNIKRTLTHSHFNRGDYLNNIGLFEHAEPIFKKQYYVVSFCDGGPPPPLVICLRWPSVFIGSFYMLICSIGTPKSFLMNDKILETYEKQMAIVDWELNFSPKGDVSDSIANKVRPIFSDKCATYANPIVEKLRPYEICVTFEQTGPDADHGAMFVMNSKIIGFFSWGDIRGRGVPLIILNFLHFREWFESIVY